MTMLWHLLLVLSFGICASKEPLHELWDDDDCFDQHPPVYNGKSCQELVNISLGYCYTTIYEHCCISCNMNRLPFKNCEFGDRSLQCKTSDCNFYDKETKYEICCKTCQNLLSVQERKVNTKHSTLRSNQKKTLKSLRQKVLKKSKHLGIKNIYSTKSARTSIRKLSAPNTDVSWANPLRNIPFESTKDIDIWSSEENMSIKNLQTDYSEPKLDHEHLPEKLSTDKKSETNSANEYETSFINDKTEKLMKEPKHDIIFNENSNNENEFTKRKVIAKQFGPKTKQNNSHVRVSMIRNQSNPFQSTNSIYQPNKKINPRSVKFNVLLAEKATKFIKSIVNKILKSHNKSMVSPISKIKPKIIGTHSIHFIDVTPNVPDLIHINNLQSKLGPAVMQREASIKMTGNNSSAISEHNAPENENDIITSQKPIKIIDTVNLLKNNGINDLINVKSNWTVNTDTKTDWPVPSVAKSDWLDPSDAKSDWAIPSGARSDWLDHSDAKSDWTLPTKNALQLAWASDSTRKLSVSQPSPGKEIAEHITETVIVPAAENKRVNVHGIDALHAMTILKESSASETMMGKNSKDLVSTGPGADVSNHNVKIVSHDIIGSKILRHPIVKEKIAKTANNIVLEDSQHENFQTGSLEKMEFPVNKKIFFDNDSKTKTLNDAILPWKNDKTSKQTILRHDRNNVSSENNFELTDENNENISINHSWYAKHLQTRISPKVSVTSAVHDNLEQKFGNLMQAPLNVLGKPYNVSISTDFGKFRVHNDAISNFSNLNKHKKPTENKFTKSLHSLIKDKNTVGAKHPVHMKTIEHTFYVRRVPKSKQVVPARSADTSPNHSIQHRFRNNVQNNWDHFWPNMPFASPISSAFGTTQNQIAGSFLHNFPSSHHQAGQRHLALETTNSGRSIHSLQTLEPESFQSHLQEMPSEGMHLPTSSGILSIYFNTIHPPIVRPVMHPNFLGQSSLNRQADSAKSVDSSAFHMSPGTSVGHTNTFVMPSINLPTSQQRVEQNQIWNVFLQ